MSDDLRKGLGDQVEEKVTPQSQKSYTQVAGENISGAADKVAGAFQPEQDKSLTQKIGDTTRSNTDGAENNSSSLLNSAKNTGTGTANYVSDTIISATDSLKGKTEEAQSS